MPGRVDHLEGQTSRVDHVAVGERSNFVRRDRRDGDPGSPARRVGQGELVLLVDEEGNLAAAHVRGRADVVEVPMGGEDGHGSLAGCPEQTEDAIGEESGVDDHGLFASLSRQEPAVRGEGIVGERLQVHTTGNRISGQRGDRRSRAFRTGRDR